MLARDIELFTDISGNCNPLHYDEELTKATKFGGIIVPLGITSAILNTVVALGYSRAAGTVFLHVDWRFKALVRPGDKIINEVEYFKVRTDKPITELKTTVMRDGGIIALGGKARC